MDNNNMYETENYGYEPERTVPESKPILVMGILSCALCWLFGAGIIFGAIGLSKAKAYAAVSRFDGKARAGKITSLIGLISSICLLVYYIVLLLIVVGIASMA